MRVVKKIVSLFVVVVMMVTCINVSTKTIDAKTFPYINYKSVYLVEGKTFKVKLMSVPKKAKVKWRSTNKKVATVKAGKIKGIGAGKCKITAKYKNKKYTCKVSVQRDLTAKGKKFKGVTFNMTGLKMDVQKITYSKEAAPVYSSGKGQFQLKVFNTKKSAKWKSSNKKIATVSKKGLVTAEAPGSCKITATVAGKKISCSVTVTNLKNEDQIAIQQIRYEMLRILNEDRIKAKAKPLKLMDKLNRIADIRAKEASQTWSHSRPNGQPFSTVYNQVGMKKGKVVGENIAYTASTPGNVGSYVKYAYKQLYDNLAHKQLMLDSKYECVGIGYYDAKHDTDKFGNVTVQSYWTQEFYTK